MIDLRELRRRMGWTQRDLARALEVSPSMVSLLENGRRELGRTGRRQAARLLARATAHQATGMVPHAPPAETPEQLMEHLETCPVCIRETWKAWRRGG